MNSPKISNFWVGTGIFCITFAAFSGSLDHDFVNWDDPVYVVENTVIRDLDWAHLKLMFSTFQYGFYAPLSQASMAVDYACWGLNPMGYHLTNLVLHAFNVVLIFFLGRKLMFLAAPAGTGFSESMGTFGSAGAALFFAVHPLRVESVVWVSERRDVLSSLLVLGCLLFYLRYVIATHTQKGGGGWFVAGFALFVMAVLAKPTAVMLTLVLILLDIYPLRRMDGFHLWPQRGVAIKVLLEKIPFLIISLFMGTGIIHAIGCGYLENRAYSMEELTWSARIAQSFAANLHYLNKLIVPVGLSPLYPMANFNFSQPAVWLGMLVTTGITVLGVVWFRRWPALLIAWLSYLAFIGPFLGAFGIGPQFAADRYTYLSSISLCIVAGALLRHWGEHGKWRVAMVIMTLVVLGLSGLTIRQTMVWRNSETLWRHAVEENPLNAGAWVYLAETLDQAGKKEQALRCARIVTRRFPRYSEGWFELGCLLGLARRYAEALDVYRHCLELSPRFARAHQNIGWIYCELGQWQEALRSLQTAQNLKPAPALVFGTGLCYEKLGNYEAAIRHYHLATVAGFQDARPCLNRLLNRREP